jgi:hypothetical protein
MWTKIKVSLHLSCRLAVPQHQLPLKYMSAFSKIKPTDISARLTHHAFSLLASIKMATVLIASKCQYFYRYRVSNYIYLEFKILTAPGMKMAVLWFVVPCRSATVHRRFRSVCCLHFALMMEAAISSETLANFYKLTQRNNPENSHLTFMCFTLYYVAAAIESDRHL